MTVMVFFLYFLKINSTSFIIVYKISSLNLTNLKVVKTNYIYYFGYEQFTTILGIFSNEMLSVNMKVLLFFGFFFIIFDSKMNMWNTFGTMEMIIVHKFGFSSKTTFQHA